MGRDEQEAAYFTLLRAREELDDIRRYGEYLAEEARRLRRFMAEGQAHADGIDRRLRRALRHTDTPLADAVEARLAVIADELRGLPERETAADAFVTECEQEYTALQRGS
jgi:phage shock protein A